MRRPNQWISDDKVKKCQLCGDNFNAVNRKHHCRSCGNVLCQKCSSETAILPDLGIRDIVRVCDICYKNIVLNRMRSNGLLTNEELYSLDRNHNNMYQNDQNDADDMVHDDEYYYGLNREWRTFIAHNDCDKLDAFDDELKELIRNGVPSIIRGHIWKKMVSFQNLKDFNVEYYETEYTLKKKQNNEETKDLEENEDNEENGDKEQKEDIYLTMEKDLQRTYPIHTTYKNERSIHLLRNILQKYSVRNSDIGYCQSMNFLGGILLLFLNESDSFWMLSYLIEKICCLFDEYFYHQSDILGVKLDGFVFNDIIREYLPDLYQHLVNIDGTDNKNNPNFNAINNLTFHWFLSLFINTLSYKSLLRVWDNMICYDNINIIFRAALAILKIKSNEMLKCREFYQIHDILSNKNILTDPKIQNDTDSFIKICLNNSEFKDIDDFILKQRIYHRNKLDDDYIGSQIYNDIEINLISEYADYTQPIKPSNDKVTLTEDYRFDDDDSWNDENSKRNSWIIYSSKKTILPVSVRKFTSDTPRRSISNLDTSILEKPSKQSCDKNLNINNTNKYYFQSDDNDSIDNINNTATNDHTYDLFKSSPSLNSLTRAPPKKAYRSKSETNVEDDDDMITYNNGIDSSQTSPRFESQLLISKSYHRTSNNRRAWSLDDDVILVASPGRKTLFDDYIHIAASTK